LHAFAQRLVVRGHLALELDHVHPPVSPLVADVVLELEAALDLQPVGHEGGRCIICTR
jgi:hypothetical protein